MRTTMTLLMLKQLVIAQSEGGEELSLHDMNGVFLRIPCTSSRTSSAPSREVAVGLQDIFALQENIGFSVEENCLEHVFSLMEQELVKTQTQLLEVQEEVVCLRSKIADHSSKFLKVQRE